MMSMLIEELPVSRVNAFNNSSDVSAPKGTTVEVVAYLALALYPSLLSCIAVILLGIFLKRRNPLSKDPDELGSVPGPRWYIPYLGSLTFIGRRWFDSLANLRRKYGDVYLLRVGTRPVVVLNGFRTIHRALVGGGEDTFEEMGESRQRARSFSGRPNLHSFQLASRGRSMSFNSYSEHWKQHRRLAERAMREMTQNETFWKDVVCKEARRLKDFFLSKVGQGAFDPNNEVLWSVARIKYDLCYGGTDTNRQPNKDKIENESKEQTTEEKNSSIKENETVKDFVKVSDDKYKQIISNEASSQNNILENDDKVKEGNKIENIKSLGKRLQMVASEWFEFLKAFLNMYKKNRDSCVMIGGRPRCCIGNQNGPATKNSISDNSDKSTERNDEQDFTKMIDNTNKLIEFHARGSVLDFFPWTKIFLSPKIRSLEEICAEMLSITERKHQQHLKTYSSETVRDLQDALIKHGLQNKRCQITDSNQIMMTVQEYIGAGLDIIQASMQWLLLYLVNYPHIQTRIQEEIDTVIGRDRQPNILDVPSLPITESFILEVLRHASVVPLALPHSTIEDTNINGLVIPRDTFIMVNLYSVNHDVELWKNPWDFCPERHLQGSGADEGTEELASARRKRSVQWGMGRRRCLGEEFSKAELIIYVTSLLQSCSLMKSRDINGRCESYSLEPKIGIVLKPKQFNIVVVQR